MIIWVSIINLLLFRLGFWICGYFHVKGSTDWWDLRLAIYTFNILLSYATVLRISSETKTVKEVYHIAFLFLVWDIIDRYFFGITEYNAYDILIDSAAIIYATRTATNYAKNNRIK